jgi:mannose-6-phosphate isomerase-like protein (cupin superfamily)
MRDKPHVKKVPADGATGSSVVRTKSPTPPPGLMRSILTAPNPHYHKKSTELYYVLDGGGTVKLDGVEHQVTKGSLVHIPPRVVHSAHGRMRVLVVGIPDIDDNDYYEAPSE